MLNPRQQRGLEIAATARIVKKGAAWLVPAQSGNGRYTVRPDEAKFPDDVRSKTSVAMVNEVLCKIICHNICCLIQEMHELGISTELWKNQDAASISCTKLFRLHNNLL